MPYINEVPFELDLRRPGDDDTGRFSFASGSSVVEELLLAPTESDTAKFSIASASSYKFGDERMNLAREGNLNRRSLEVTCLSAEGEEGTPSCTFIFTMLPIDH